MKEAHALLITELHGAIICHWDAINLQKHVILLEHLCCRGQGLHRIQQDAAGSSREL